MSKANKFIEDEKGEMGGLMGDLLLAVITVFVLAVLASALAPTAITTLANTTAITGYTTWSASTQSIWGTLQIFAVVVILILFVAILLGVIKRYG